MHSRKAFGYSAFDTSRLKEGRNYRKTLFSLAK